MSLHSKIRALSLLAAVLAAAPTQADEVQIAPYAGYQFGGVDASLSYGGTIDVAISPGWRVEGLYTRQSSTGHAGGPGGEPFNVDLDRLMFGFKEEQGQPEDRARPFGTVLLGATRFSPQVSGYGSQTRFTFGLSLGVRSALTNNLGLRLEARGFYTPISSSGNVICSGGCLVTISGSGLWQGEVSAGLSIGF